jgi:hypothetical protein
MTDDSTSTLVEVESSVMEPRVKVLIYEYIKGAPGTIGHGGEVKVLS